MTPDRPAPAASPDALAHATTEAGQAVPGAIRATPCASVEVVLHKARIVQVVPTRRSRLHPPAD